MRTILFRAFWIVLWALAAGPALAQCPEKIDKLEALCGRPVHAAKADCPGCGLCDQHCMVATTAAGNRCPTCNGIQVDTQCYNARCPEYSRSKFGAKPRLPPLPSPTASPGAGSPAPPSPAPPSPAPPSPAVPLPPGSGAIGSGEFTPDAPTEAAIAQRERAAEDICTRLGLPPGECFENQGVQDLINQRPAPERDLVAGATRGPAAADPAPVITAGPGVDAFIAFTANDGNGAHVLAVDPTGQPYAGIPVTVVVEGQPPTSGVTDAAGWFRAISPVETVGRRVTVTLGPPAAVEVREIRTLSWLVARVPRRAP